MVNSVYFKHPLSNGLLFNFRHQNWLSDYDYFIYIGQIGTIALNRSIVFADPGSHQECIDLDIVRGFPGGFFSKVVFISIADPFDANTLGYACGSALSPESLYRRCDEPLHPCGVTPTYNRRFMPIIIISALIQCFYSLLIVLLSLTSCDFLVELVDLKVTGLLEKLHFPAPQK